MPFYSREDINSVYYELHGDGPPLLLVSGLSGGTWTWSGLTPDFQQHYRVITFDNRGAGRSAIPPGPYKMQEFAADALGLLDHLQVESAYVLGISMGGMIAQELALLAPHKIKALVLGCTNCGGRARISPAREAMALLMNNDGLSPEQVTEKNLPLFLSEECRRNRPEIVEAYRNLQLQALLQPEFAFIAQLQAINAFDCCDRLPEIQVPTLIISGTEDVLVPVENARYLAAHIPGAELVEIRGAGHALHAECREQLFGLAHTFFKRYAY